MGCSRRGVRLGSWELVAGLALGLASTAAAAPASSLARYVPSERLVALFEFDGLEAHQDAWKKTAASKALNDTPLGALLRDLAGQGFDFAKRQGPALPRIFRNDLPLLLDHVAQKGFAAGVVFAEQPRVVVVFRDADRPEIARLLEAAGDAGRPQGARGPEPLRKAGRTIHPAGSDVAWWIEGRDVVFSSTNSVDDVLAVLDGKAKSAVGHPRRAALSKAVSGFEPVGFGFLDLTVFHLGGLSQEAMRLGLDGAKSVEFQWGFQADALKTVARLDAPSPRRGLLKLFDQPRFDARSLLPIPPALTSFYVWSIDPLKTYDQVRALVQDASPKDVKVFDEFEKAARDRIGLDLRIDLLKQLGPRFAIYALPVGTPPARIHDPAVIADPRAAAVLRALPGLVMGASVPDEAALGAKLDGIVKAINRSVAEQAKGLPEPPRFVRNDGPGVQYEMDLSRIDSDGLLARVSPTIALAGGQLILAGSRDAARQAVAAAGAGAGGRWRPTKAFIPLAENLPRGMTMLWVSDVRESLPDLIAGLPRVVPAINAQLAEAARAGTAPGFAIRIDPAKVPTADQLRRLLFPASSALTVDDQGIELVQRESLPSLTSPVAVGGAAALLLPAVQSAREAARRAHCVNDLKWIGLAFHNYLSVNGVFPSNIAGKDGKPLLSWRVAILPYIEQAELYNRFKLDEPWNSPHNKPLLSEVPKIFHCPSNPPADPSWTSYLSFEGPGALMENGRAVGIGDCTDGTPNTLAVVETSRGVPWTKPEDLPFDPEAKVPLYGASSKHPGGFNALFADGSVRFLKGSIGFVPFKAMITRAGGEVIPPGGD